MENFIKFNIKPGTFIKQSNIDEYNSSYQGLHSEESESFSLSQKDIKDNASLSENNSINKSLSDSLSSLKFYIHLFGMKEEQMSKSQEAL